MLNPIPLNHVVEWVNEEYWSHERRTLKTLAGVSLSGETARTVWPRILEHKWYMSERMGRDVGLRVAAVDFFEHVQPPPCSAPAPRRALLADPVRWLERVLSGFTSALRGTRAIALFRL